MIVKMDEKAVVQKKISLEDVKPIESVGINLWKYDKKDVEIDNAEVIEVPSKFNPLGKQWVLKISSKVLESFGEGGDLVEFRASELFNLIQDNETGELLGYPTGDNSNLMQFCHDLKVELPKTSTLKDLVDKIRGKRALIKAYDKEIDGRTKTYLRFRY